MINAKKAYQKMMAEVTNNGQDKNPTWALSSNAIDNIVGKRGRLFLAWEGLIKYVGKYNGFATYQIRF